MSLKTKTMYDNSAIEITNYKSVRKMADSGQKSYDCKSILLAVVFLVITASVCAQASYYYPRNLVAPQFRNKGDLFLNVITSTKVTDFGLGYATTNHLAFYASRSIVKDSYSDDVIVDNRRGYSTYRNSSGYTLGFGRYLNEMTSESTRLGLFAEFSSISDKTVASSLNKPGVDATMFTSYNITALRANVLIRDANLETKSRLGYNVRAGQMRYVKVNNRSVEIFGKEYDRIRSSERYWILEHGVNLVIVGKRLSVYGQLNFNHCFYGPHVDGPMPRFFVTSAIGVSLMPNILGNYEIESSDTHILKEILPESPIQPTNGL